MEFTPDMAQAVTVLIEAAAEYGGDADEVQAPLETFHAAVLAAGSVTEVWMPDAFVQPGDPPWILGYADVNGWCIAMRESTGFEDPQNEESPRTWGAPIPLLEANRLRRYSAIQQLQFLVVSVMIAPT